MLVETYVEVLVENDPKNPAFQEALRVVEEEIRVSRSLGLAANAETLMQHLPTLDRLRFTQTLKPERYEDWETYLPIHYRMLYDYDGSDISLRGCGPRESEYDALSSLEEYDQNRIPRAVLEMMRRATEEWRFDWLELRLSRYAPDAVALFGGIGNRSYLIARWAEHAEQLVPLSHVPRYAVELKRMNDKRNGMMTAILFLSLLGIVGSLAVGGVTHSFLLGLGVGALCLIGVILISTQEEKLRKSKLTLYPNPTP